MPQSGRNLINANLRKAKPKLFAVIRQVSKSCICVPYYFSAMACTPVAKSFTAAGVRRRFCFQKKLPSSLAALFIPIDSSHQKPNGLVYFARLAKAILPSLDQPNPVSIGVLTYPICDRVQNPVLVFCNVDNFGFGLPVNSAHCPSFSRYHGRIIAPFN